MRMTFSQFVKEIKKTCPDLGRRQALEISRSILFDWSGALNFNLIKEHFFKLYHEEL